MCIVRFGGARDGYLGVHGLLLTILRYLVGRLTGLGEGWDRGEASLTTRTSSDLWMVGGTVAVVAGGDARFVGGDTHGLWWVFIWTYGWIGVWI